MQSNDFIKSAVAASLIILLFIIFWEYHWRSKGYVISYNEDKVLWANNRKKVYLPKDQATVFIGDSRIKFDIDLPTWEALTGEEAIQLALVGTTPTPVLINLANDEHFRGKVIIGAQEAAFYSLDNSLRERSAREGIEYFKSETPAQKLNASIDFLLESKFVFLEEGKFGLNNLLTELNIPNRPGVTRRIFPPKDFSYSTISRQSLITDMFFKDTVLRNKVINTWRLGAALNKPVPIKGDTLQAFFALLRNSIDKIKSRGGSVVFVRPPSGGTFLARENKLFPRAEYWDQLLKYTHVSGFYYKDFPTVADMVCPEESHLSPSDAKIFTKTLINFLKEKAGWTFREPADSLVNQIKE